MTGAEDGFIIGVADLKVLFFEGDLDGDGVIGVNVDLRVGAQDTGFLVGAADFEDFLVGAVVEGFAVAVNAIGFRVVVVGLDEGDIERMEGCLLGELALGRAVGQTVEGVRDGF